LLLRFCGFLGRVQLAQVKAGVGDQSVIVGEAGHDAETNLDGGLGIEVDPVLDAAFLEKIPAGLGNDERNRRE
jgi:hypothetical protein